MPSCSLTTMDSGQPGGATGGATGPQTFSSQVKVKKKNSGDSTVGHLHHFTVKFSSSSKFKMRLPRKKGANDSLGSSNNSPQMCDTRTYLLHIFFYHPGFLQVDQLQKFTMTFRPDKYKYIIEWDQSCTVLEALKSNKKYNELMFSEENILIQLGEADKKVIVATHFPCTCIKDNESLIIHSTSEKVEKLQQKENRKQILSKENAKTKFLKKGIQESKICRQRNKKIKGPDKYASNSVIVKKKVKVRSRFQKIKRYRKNYTYDLYQQALDLRREDFGKTQNSFNKVDTIEKVIKQGKSVCLLYIECESYYSYGTGFVLFDNYILTNDHVIKKFAEQQGEKWLLNTTVNARFNYKNDNESEWIRIKVKREVVIMYDELFYDYAILELEAHNENIPGLLKHFGDLPLNGEACIVGHPGRGVKQMDTISIIEKEKRWQAVNDHLNLYKNGSTIFNSIKHLIKEQGIEKIMMGGEHTDNLLTYKTSMCHGSSGSPVFNAHGQVFGLHTGGYGYESPNHKKSVIAFAQPVLRIFEHFVSTLKERREDELLGRFAEKVKGNPDLENLFKSEVQPMDID